MIKTFLIAPKDVIFRVTKLEAIYILRFLKSRIGEN